MHYVPIKELKKLRCKETFPKGANAATIVTRYRCLCGLGQIVEENTPGFHDHFVTLKCLICLRKYKYYVDISGYDFVFYPAK